MQQTLINIFGKHYRTTLAGIAGAIFTACYPLIQKGNFDPHTDWPQLVKAAGIALFGYLVPDLKTTDKQAQP